MAGVPMPSVLARGLDDLAAAAGFLTRLPVPGGSLGSGRPLAERLWAFPLVGLLVGALAAAGLLVAHRLGLPASLGALVALAVAILATGALHEDGLADLCDGLGGGQTRERKLEIMRDSRIGTYGVLALGLVVGARWAALAALPADGAAVGLLIAHAGARGLLAVPLLLLAPARPDGLAAAAGRPAAAPAALALILAALPALVLWPVLAGLVALLLALLGVGAITALAQRHLGGGTGDVLGAAEQAAETLILLAAVGLAR